ncbi:unnamed protein product [Arctia plantaginis]|uniref:Carboxylesterase type B domain-containing protein n=1 Tax=Arctia plantaginis TaxID=874455 RepID=A0A8S1B5Y9_ARCPL|nr:unnamed protein product [Arctia plantaginis]
MCCILCVFIVFIACVFGQTGPVVDTSVGQIVGLKDEFIKFLGIPYAFIDVNDPFGPAKLHLPFETPYHATRNPVICPQLANGTLQGDIQCLNLNVYSPITSGQKKLLPVMVFIHGGAFTEVIMQGLQLASPGLSGKPKNYEYLTDLAVRVGLDSKYVETKDIVRELSKVSMDLLVNVTYSDRFRPCIDNSVIGDSSLNQNLKDVKIIIGSASKESLFIYNNEPNYANLIKRELKKEFDNIEHGVDRVENYYLNNNLKNDVVDFGCDFIFNYPLERSVRHLMRSNATIYRYLFSYNGGRNFIKFRDGIDAEGATHGDELGYLFDPDLFGDAITARDQSVIDTITTFWTNFAKFGDPTPSELSPVTLWPVLDERSNYIDIGTTPLVEAGYRKDQITFWDSFYEEFGALSKGLYYVEENV